MNKRRSFLKCFGPALAATAISPVAVAAVAVVTPSTIVPMRGVNEPLPDGVAPILGGNHSWGVYPTTTEWSMIKITKFPQMGFRKPDFEFTTSHMEQRPDGHYILVWDKDK